MHRVRHGFAWLGGITFILLCVAMVTVLVFRALVVPWLAGNIFIKHPATPDRDTPMTYGAPYHALKIASHGRTLDGWTVDAGAGTPALLLFDGNGLTIHGLSQVQAWLFHHGVSSMAFDYSGFGASTGKPTVTHLDQDATAAWQAFARWAGHGHPEFALGYSLGTAVLLNNVHTFAPQPRSVIVYGAFSNTRQLMRYISVGLPGWAFDLMPDVWDSAEAATRLRQPLLVVSGMDDVNVPPLMSRRLALFAGDGGNFVLIPGAGHGGILNPQKYDAVWNPIIAFIRKRSETRGAAGVPSSSAPPSQPASATTAQP